MWIRCKYWFLDENQTQKNKKKYQKTENKKTQKKQKNYKKKKKILYRNVFITLSV